MKSNPSKDDARPEFTDEWLRAQHLLGGFIRMHVHDYNMAEDVMQDVARQASANFDQYDPNKPFLAWLFGIARQRIAEHFRVQKRKPLIFSSEVVDAFVTEAVALQPEVNERIEALRLCLENLPDRHRLAMELRYDRKQTSEQIAEQLGGNAVSIDSTLYRVRSALKQCIRKRMEGSH